MKPNKQEEYYKEYVQLLKRRQEIWEIERQASYIPIKEPYQDGWTLSWRLTDEAYRRDDGPRMLEALNLCNKSYITRDAARISKVRKDKSHATVTALFTKRWVDPAGETRYAYYGAEIRAIKSKVYDSLHENIKKFFYKDIHTSVSRWGGATHETITYILNIPKHYIELRVKKRIITKIKNINPSLRGEKDEINMIIDQKFYEFQSRGQRHYRWNIKNSTQTARRHSKDAIKKVMKGEIESPEQYSKLNKIK